jgi:hypothetical protein
VTKLLTTFSCRCTNELGYPPAGHIVKCDHCRSEYRYETQDRGDATWGRVVLVSQCGIKTKEFVHMEHIERNLGTQVIGVRRTDVPPPVIPNGEYVGYWTGNIVTWLTPADGAYAGKTADSIRGVDIPCLVTVNQGVVLVKPMSKT